MIYPRDKVIPSSNNRALGAYLIFGPSGWVLIRGGRLFGALGSQCSWRFSYKWRGEKQQGGEDL